MRYMLIIRNGEDHPQPGDDRFDQMMADYGALSEQIASYGAGAALVAPDLATTVRVKGGEVMITDGPFAETKEWFSGYYVVDVASLDEALAVAGKIPTAKWGSVEVRPVWEM